MSVSRKRNRLDASVAISTRWRIAVDRFTPPCSQSTLSAARIRTSGYDHDA